MKARLLFFCFFLVGCAGVEYPHSHPLLHRAPAPHMHAGQSCRPLTSADRARLLVAADPGNFPRTRYRQGPRAPVERETDCSHFVHEIYRRAGLPYDFRSSRNLHTAPEFEVLPEEEARPGDVMVFRGHVGIVDENGQIISATRTRKRSLASSITRQDRKNFHKPRGGERYVLRYRCNEKTEQAAN